MGRENTRLAEAAKERETADPKAVRKLFWISVGVRGASGVSELKKDEEYYFSHD